MNERFEHVLHLTKENARLDQFIKTKTREVLACKKTYDKLTLKITRTIKEFDQRARGLHTFLVRFLDQYDPHQENRDMDCLREDISRLTVMLEKIVLYADILGEKFLANMNDEFIQDGYGIFNSYITKANALVETIARVKGELTNLMAAKAKEAEEHTKVSEAEAIKQAEQNRLLSLQQQEQKSKQWKEIFEKRREEKQIIAAVAMQPVPEPPAVIVDFDQTTLMTERIKCLGTKKLWLLERLFNLEYGIRYRKLANLVKNKLGGTIEEYGSSHKRIRIGGHSALIDGEDDEGLVATGGMFKPHGKKHQPGILGPFNMKLVIATFKRAGITPELLAAVAAERQRPAASNASAVQSESTRVVICPK